MKAKLNVIGFCVVDGLSAVLLSACDSRMGSGFKSANMKDLYDKKMAEKAASDRQNNANADVVAPEPIDPNLAAGQAASTVAPETGKITPPAVTDVTPALPVVTEPVVAAPPAPPIPTEPIDVGSAGLKVFYEATGETKVLKTQFQTLLDAVDKGLPNGKDPIVDPAAAEIVKGVDLNVAVTADTGTVSYSLSMESRIEILGFKRNLFAKQEIGFSDSKIAQLKLDMGLVDKSKPDELAKDGTVVGFGFCREAACETIHVVLEFQKSILAIFAMKIKNGKFEVVGHNLGPDLKTFVGADAPDAVKTPEQIATEKAAADKAAADQASATKLKPDGQIAAEQRAADAKAAAIKAAEAKRITDAAALEVTAAQTAIDNAGGKKTASGTIPPKPKGQDPKSFNAMKALEDKRITDAAALEVTAAQTAIDSAGGAAAKKIGIRGRPSTLPASDVVVAPIKTN